MKLSVILIALVLLFSCGKKKDIFVDEGQPNIVFIFTDDQTYTAVHALGNDQIQTPNIDRLANMGTTFTNTFNMGAWNGAVCQASRAMLVSGRSLWRANHFRRNWLEGDSLDLTWSRLLEKRGYSTYMTGKWHVDAPADQIFQNVTHVRPGMPPDRWQGSNVGQKLKQTVNGKAADPYEVMPVGYARPRDENDSSWTPWDTSFGGFWEGGTHWSEVLKNDALDFIHEASQKEAPFFMYFAFNAPHDPRQSPKSYIDRYDLEKISLPPDWMPDHRYRDSIGLGWDLRDEALAPIPRSKYATRVQLREYYAIVTHLDEQIGLILDALEKSGKMKNTYIFFTSDHGLALGRHGLFGKQNMYEHSIRVPLIVTGPDIPQNMNVEAEVYLQDLMPTSLELAGIQKPAYVDFYSLLDMAKGIQNNSAYNAIYGAYINWQRMIRKNGYKLIVYPQAEDILLFDLSKDPYELNNLAKSPAHQSQMESLFDDLQELQVEMEDTLDLTPVFTRFMAENFEIK